MQHRVVTARGWRSSGVFGQRWGGPGVGAVAAVAIAALIGGSLLTSVSFAADAAPAVPQALAPSTVRVGPLEPIASQPAPMIYVDSVDYDFGDTWLGPPVDFSYTIYNRGSATLRIESVQPQCGCTVAGDYPHEIEPGKSGKFPFTMTTESFSGKVVKDITIVSNDPARPSLLLRVRGNFRRRLDVQPAGAFFGTIIGDESVSRTVKITNNTDKPLELKMAPVKSDRFTFELVETVKTRVFELRIATIVPYKPGEIAVTAVLNSNIEEQKTINVTAAGRIPDRLDLWPATMPYSRPTQLPPGRDYAQLPFWLTNYGASLVNVKEAALDDSRIKALVEARSPGKLYRIEVEVPIDVVIPPQGRLLTIKTDDPDKPVLTARILPQSQPAAQTAQNTTTKPGFVPPKPAETMVGQPAPAFSLKTLDNRGLASEDLKGKITVLNFISPSCPWCRKQVPDVEKIRSTYQVKGIRFVNVVAATVYGKTYSDDEIAQAVKAMNSSLEIAPDPAAKVGLSFRATSYPSLFVIGKDAKVAAVNVGANKTSLLQGQLDALLAGKPVPVATQTAQTAPPPPIEALVGQPAPVFSLKTLDNRALTRDDLNGKVTVLNFISPTCPWCRKQVPEVEKVRAAYQDKGVRFVNVVNPNSYGGKVLSDAEVAQAIKAMNSNLEIAPDATTKVGESFRARSYPSMFVIGKDAKIAAVDVGFNNVGLLRGQIDALLAGKPVSVATQPH